jgi:hypothetical protein
VNLPVDEIRPWCSAHPQFYFRATEACPACACLRQLEQERLRAMTGWKLVTESPR